MPRRLRLTVPGLPHHVTQRGIRRIEVFPADANFRVFLDLLLKYSEKYDLSIWGYCLMPNHFHLVVVPGNEQSISKVVGQAEADYARYLNLQGGYSGHLWQARFYSSPMEPVHCWKAMAYVERNPVRAGIVSAPESYRWSSAGAHLGIEPTPRWLYSKEWAALWTPSEWRKLVEDDTAQKRLGAELRHATLAGLPLGEELKTRLESSLGLDLRAGKVGRPRTKSACASIEPDPTLNSRQGLLSLI